MTDSVVGRQTEGDFGKPLDGFDVRKTSLEPDGLELGIDQTPVDRFFVCSAGAAVRFAPGEWRLAIDGDAAGRSQTLDLEALRALPRVEVDAWLECAGNGRRLYELVGGYERPLQAGDTHWLTGAMGMARWGGVRLADVLALAEPTESFAYVAPMGLDVDNEDGEPVRMSLPAAKALDPDTLIAFEMNGEPLPVAHGAPARLLVPGWVGAYSVKWLGRLELASDWVASYRADVYYRLREPDGTDLGPATTHPVKSTLTTPWEGEVAAGAMTLHGYARSSAAAIERVEWSVDGGPWHEATLAQVDGRWTWTPFSLTVELDPGRHEIRTRATDGTGATQPDTVPYHPNTVLWNAVTPHPVQAV